MLLHQMSFELAEFHKALLAVWTPVRVLPSVHGHVIKPARHRREDAIAMRTRVCLLVNSQLWQSSFTRVWVNRHRLQTGLLSTLWQPCCSCCYHGGHRVRQRWHSPGFGAAHNAFLRRYGQLTELHTRGVPRYDEWRVSLVKPSKSQSGHHLKWQTTIVLNSEFIPQEKRQKLEFLQISSQH